MLLRIQSPEGTRRVEVRSGASTSRLFEKVKEAFDLSSFSFAIYKSRGQKDEIVASKSKKVDGHQLHHGDMLYMVPLSADLFPSTSENMETQSEPESKASSTTASLRESRSQASLVAKSDVEEELVDQLLWRQDGKIPRARDERLCRHGPNGRCIHCSPLEPYDATYLKDNNIKHMSFHSYLRKLTGGVDKGKFAALDDLSCKIKPGCTDHPPWPKGICSKCQPSAVTLNRQTYRHVDNVMFENPALVERFLNYWRVSGHQRVGILIGKFEVHKDVPLGIKATVTAIYEPPQESSREHVRLLEDPQSATVDELSGALGMQRVGWIFTDLIAEDIAKGTVKHLRGMDTWFLSAQECMMAGHLQAMHPNPCRLAPSGYFGSKFVTVVVSGDRENQVHMEGYQLSNQGTSLVRDGCYVPTKDAPELAWIRESSNQQYVPDVFYKEKDGYGNEVTKLARPLPIAYLLVDVPASTPLEPVYTFRLPPAPRSQFPVENRLLDGHMQNFSALSAYLHRVTEDDFLSAVSDFHVLLYLATMDTVHIKAVLPPLLSAVRQQDQLLAHEFYNGVEWQTVLQLMEASSASATGSGAQMSQSVGADAWPCQHCTFLNRAESASCEICQLPKM
ncbi:nuclear protein localization protein 4 homolog [Pollicipes pollicipes]|uniref:nuclear protein localization protein 4 homolog n=1 Tax=Pollicipes pollicipes TaxID=41117 RepID=UPI001884A218|nr:nuclear protein localization protein 4 homolog [Pollicipes pollicipes]XP_037093893.1 nuclear protein localization protein 4 homolog [Pollicipes pollicipes]